MENNLEQPLRKAINFLEAHNLRYAVIGGIALTHWGFIRATHDVDIKVLVPEMNFAAVRAAIHQAFPVPARDQGQPNPFITAVNIDGVIVDFLLSLPGYEENIISRAVQRDMGGWVAWICSLEDLIIQKAIAGRAKDWEDIEGLLIEQKGKLDEGYISEWLIQFSEALDRPELLSRYKKLHDDVKNL